jgi:hypothetical protein
MQELVAVSQQRQQRFRELQSKVLLGSASREEYLEYRRLQEEKKHD